MTGFWALARKELLEQRRTWKFLAVGGTFIGIALLMSLAHFITDLVRDLPNTPGEAREVLRAYGFVTVGFGTFLTIIVAMGSLAGERASGTAAMTLSKPVSRSAFVATKFLGLLFSIFAALAIGSTTIYVLTLLLIENGGLAEFARFMAIIGVYLAFIGSIAFFWSGMFSRQLLAGGIALFLFGAQVPLSEIPHTQRFWPINTVEWAQDLFPEVREVGPIDEVIISTGGASRESLGGSAVRFRPGYFPYQRFQQLETELADLEDIDALAPAIFETVRLVNLRTSREESEMGVGGVEPFQLRYFGDEFTPTSPLEGNQGYISESAARELDARVGGTSCACSDRASPSRSN